MASGDLAILNPQFSQCAICLEDFKKPKFLNCHHSFCMECIRDLEKLTPGTVSCPLCQRKVQLPSGGVEQLTSNFYILNINTNKPGDGLQTVISEDDSNKKTIYVDYDGDGVEAEFNGVKFMLIITNDKTSKVGSIVALSFMISEPVNESCDIDYNISLVSQKGREYSVKRKGNCNIEQGRWFWIHLIQKADALDIENGFIVKEITDETGKKIQTFQLNVGMTFVVDSNNITPVICDKNPIKPVESLRTVISEDDSNKKTIYVDYDGDGVQAEFNGVKVMFIITNDKTSKMGSIVALSFMISEPVDESCDLDYDISLVSQKGRDYSVKRKGNCKIGQGRWFWIHLIQKSDALDIENGFIVKEITDETGKKILTFHLDVDITVNFNNYKPVESLQTVISEDDFNRKTIYFDYFFREDNSYCWDTHEAVFDGVQFDFNFGWFHDCEYNSHRQIHIIIRTRNSDLESCDIHYDIVFVNQKDRDKSRRHTGICKIRHSQWSDFIPLIDKYDATDDNNHFIVKEWRDASDIIRLTFQLDIGIQIRNKT